MLQAGMSQTAIAETVRTTQETMTIGFTGVRPPASEDLKLPPPPPPPKERLSNPFAPSAKQIFRFCFENVLERRVSPRTA